MPLANAREVRIWRAAVPMTAEFVKETAIDFVEVTLFVQPCSAPTGGLEPMSRRG